MVYETSPYRWVIFHPISTANFSKVLVTAHVPNQRLGFSLLIFLEDSRIWAGEPLWWGVKRFRCKTYHENIQLIWCNGSANWFAATWKGSRWTNQDDTWECRIGYWCTHWFQPWEGYDDMNCFRTCFTKLQQILIPPKATSFSWHDEVWRNSWPPKVGVATF